MASPTEILQIITDLYDTPDSDTVKTRLINMGIRELNKHVRIEKSLFFLTEAGRDAYPIPKPPTLGTGGAEYFYDVSDIIVLGITPDPVTWIDEEAQTFSYPDDRYDFLWYHRGSVNDYPTEARGFYQVTDRNGDKQLVIYPAPEYDDQLVSVRYKSRLGEYSSTSGSVTPNIDPKYFDMLAYYACNWLAGRGDVPDTLQRDMFAQLWQESLDSIIAQNMARDIKHRREAPDNRQWHGPLQHAAGEGGTIVDLDRLGAV